MHSSMLNMYKSLAHNGIIYTRVKELIRTCFYVFVNNSYMHSKKNLFRTAKLQRNMLSVLEC